MSRAKCIMVQGTMSGAGKSLLCAALCRIFAQDGLRAVPFKSQNMALNSFVTKDGLEMGRAQVVQAQAAGVEPDVRMNPILLKPSSDVGSQVIVNGEVRGQMKASEYFRTKRQLVPNILKAYDSLAEEADVIVIEGAGSPAEINLKSEDIVNMGLAEMVDAPVLLVGDIDRGGVFAQLYGTVELLEEKERRRIKGLVINKFRGDASLFEEGRNLLKELTGIPVVGVIPWFRDIKIEEEDSVALDMKNNTYKDGKINVAIILLKRMSNFTDFDVLEMDPRFNPYYTNNIDEIEKADIILLPGSKNTLSDLQSLRANGIAMAIIRAHKAGKKVIGICGGYQMMGVRLEDPESIEGNIPAIPGLGLLPQCTVIEQEKITRQSDFAFLPSSENKDCKGYEIHMGRTTLLGDAPEQPVARLEDGRTDGYYLNNRCWGSYMHGILDNPAVLDNLAEGFDTETTTGPFDYAAFKEEQYDKLAALVREHVDMEYIYNSIKN